MQGLSESAGSPVRVSFTPTLMPMSRGMQSTIYVKLANGASVQTTCAATSRCVTGLRYLVLP